MWGLDSGVKDGNVVNVEASQPMADTPSIPMVLSHLRENYEDEGDDNVPLAL